MRHGHTEVGKPSTTAQETKHCVCRLRSALSAPLGPSRPRLPGVGGLRCVELRVQLVLTEDEGCSVLFNFPVSVLSMSQVDRLQQSCSVLLELQILRRESKLQGHLHGPRNGKNSPSWLPGHGASTAPPPQLENAQSFQPLGPAFVSLSRELAALKRGLGLAHLWLPEAPCLQTQSVGGRHCLWPRLSS